METKSQFEGRGGSFASMKGRSPVLVPWEQHMAGSLGGQSPGQLRISCVTLDWLHLSLGCSFSLLKMKYPGRPSLFLTPRRGGREALSYEKMPPKAASSESFLLRLLSSQIQTLAHA